MGKILIALAAFGAGYYIALSEDQRANLMANIQGKIASLRTTAPTTVVATTPVITSPTEAASPTVGAYEIF